MMTAWNVERVRKQFPALTLKTANHPIAFFDGPGGTQVPQRVLDAVHQYLSAGNANRGGRFLTSEATELWINRGRQRMASLLNAQPEEIAFGANMTTLNYSLSRALARRLKAGDEILITDLDHEANRAPWLSLESQGITVRSVRIRPEDTSLDMEDFERKLNEKTRIVAVTAASNAVGTIPDLPKIRALAQDCWLVIDGVHATPHLPIDVRSLGCDFFLCSAYKFFGPHVGVLYGQRDVFEALLVDKLEPQKNTIPDRIETGTLNHEGIAGTAAAVEFIADPGNEGETVSTSVTRDDVMEGMGQIHHHEMELFQQLYRGLESLPDVHIVGPSLDAHRTPTLSFHHQQYTVEQVAQFLGDRGICVWDGDFYATTLVRQLGLEQTQLLRIGMAPYNTREEVDRLLQAVEDCHPQ